MTAATTATINPTPDLAALAASVHVNGTQPAQPANTKNAPDITDILDHIAKAPSRDALQADMLKCITDYAKLSDSEIEQVRAAAKQIGVTLGWLDREFKPALNRQRRAAKATVASSITFSKRIQNKLGDLGYKFSYNEITTQLLVDDQPINDGIAAEIRIAMRDADFLSIKFVEDVYTALAYRNSFNPIKQYLESLTWDGFDHIAALAAHIKDTHAPIQYSDGTSKTVFHAFLHRWLIGAVGRVYRRGVQIPMLVWSGAQGRGKSYLAKWLCPLVDMFIESAVYPDNTDHLKYLATRWIWAVDELGSTTRRADIESLKAFITKDVATFRQAYGRYDSVSPAIACFIGTVNDAGGGFLNDPTGNRRFAVVELSHIDHGYSKAIDVNQVWAQALHLYQQDESWLLTPEEDKVAADNAERQQVADPVTEVIATHFTIDPTQYNWQMTTDEIMDCLIKSHEFKRPKDKTFATAVGIALKKLDVRKERPNRVYRYIGIAHTPHKATP